MNYCYYHLLCEMLDSGANNDDKNIKDYYYSSTYY